MRDRGYLRSHSGTLLSGVVFVGYAPDCRGHTALRAAGNLEVGANVISLFFASFDQLAVINKIQNYEVIFLEGVARSFYWQQLADTGAEKVLLKSQEGRI